MLLSQPSDCPVCCRSVMLTLGLKLWTPNLAVSSLSLVIVVILVKPPAGSSIYFSSIPQFFLIILQDTQLKLRV